MLTLETSCNIVLLKHNRSASPSSSDEPGHTPRPESADEQEARRSGQGAARGAWMGSGDPLVPWAWTIETDENGSPRALALLPPGTMDHEATSMTVQPLKTHSTADTSAPTTTAGAAIAFHLQKRGTILVVDTMEKERVDLTRYYAPEVYEGHKQQEYILKSCFFGNRKWLWHVHNF